MLREEAIAQCVEKMKSHRGLCGLGDDDQKAKAAGYAFDRLHEDAVEHLPFGASEEDIRHYGKAALKRVHHQTNAMGSAEFEQAYGFPVLLVLSLLPTLWSWWRMLRSWMSWT